MQKLADKHGSPTVDRALRFFKLRAKARPETAGLVEQVQAMRVQVRDRRDAYLDAVDERIALTAELGYLDGRIDRLVMVGLKRDLAVLTADHPEGPQLEKKLFQGVAPSAAMKPVANESQGQFIAGVIQRLEEDEAYATLLPHTRKLRKAQKEIDQTLARRKEARVRENLARADLDETVDRARRFYNQLHPQLQLTFPDDAALVESYFLDLRGAPAEDGGEEGGGGGGGEGEGAGG